MPTALETLAGHDLTQLEIKVVEEKREAASKMKAALTPQAAEGEGNEEKEEGSEEESDSGDAKNTSDTASPESAEPAATPAAEAGPAIHEGVMCDSCQMSPITGIRYKCSKYVETWKPFLIFHGSCPSSSECPNFDLCQACMDKGEHNQTHEFLRISVPRVKKTVHPGVACNLCGEFPISGTRYKCME